MKKYLIAGSVAVALLIVAIFYCCNSNDSNKNGASKNSNSNTSVKTLPPLESLTTSSTVNSTVGQTPFLNADQISQTWTEEKTCGLIGGKNAKKILEMETTPEGRYKFAKESGARCTYPSKSGDEVFVEISVFSFAAARSVDRALGETGEAIEIKGVPGVLKVSEANGVTYELNTGGELSNQWIANGPDKRSAKELAETLISALR